MVECQRCIELLQLVDETLSVVVDNAIKSPGGDLVQFGSTNDFDKLRDINQLVFEHALVDQCPNIMLSGAFLPT